MVLIGGIGTIEGPILGAVIYYVMDLYFSQSGLWYLVVLGVLAVLITLYLPKGIWGEISERFNISLFPVGHRVVSYQAKSTSPRQAAGGSSRTKNATKITNQL
jgi:branched-chain amino acid transport system permease protein